ILAAHGQAASHRYQDFPFVFTPFWWHAVLKLSPFKDKRLRERAHGDGMLVNAASPEAMEEMLWNAFFAQAHRVDASQVLGRETVAPEFAAFYRKHIQKLLLAAKKPRYVSKGNYNITRMCFLRELFPDARFVIPVRDPVTHIASLMRQHARFCEAGRKDAGVVKHMSAAGHYEFGLNRVPIHTGDDAAMREVLAAWEAGEELRGWALYWAMLYRFVGEQLDMDEDLKKASMVVRYETLCINPRHVLTQLFTHCDLPVDEALIATYVPRIQKPDYYDAGFTEAELALIREITGPVAKRFGY
ncbi:MAG: sulfotransferase, partial [Rickettsiales bacterium]|nr:sulfotransferase [Rickettsiales bacterium]